MTTAFKLKICWSVLILIGAVSFGSAHGWIVGNPVPGLMQTLHQAEQAAGVGR